METGRELRDGRQVGSLAGTRREGAQAGSTAQTASRRFDGEQRASRQTDRGSREPQHTGISRRAREARQENRARTGEQAGRDSKRGCDSKARPHLGELEQHACRRQGGRGVEIRTPWGSRGRSLDRGAQGMAGPTVAMKKYRGLGERNGGWVSSGSKTPWEGQRRTRRAIGVKGAWRPWQGTEKRVGKLAIGEKRAQG